jgi:integrase
MGQSCTTPYGPVHGQVLRAALIQAADWGLLLRSPVRGVKLPGADREVNCWTEGQVTAFPEATAGKTRYDILIRRALASGMRSGERRGLRWQDVGWVTDPVHVNHSLSWPRGQPPRLKRPDGARSRRTIPLDAGTMEALRRQGRRQAHEREAAGPEWTDLGLVWPTLTGRCGERSAVERCRRTFARRAGVPVIRVHDWRHTHATRPLRRGRSLREVTHRLGHSRETVTLRYAHVLPDQRSQAVAMIGEMLGSCSLAASWDQP